MQQGLVHLYFGNGKGKTTAAMGLALRAAGNGMGVVVAQFLKDTPSGETGPLASLPGVQLLRGEMGGKFTWQMDAAELAAAGENQTALLHRAFALARQSNADLLVLDEAVGAAGCGLLDAETLENMVAGKPETLELVLTGRDPSNTLLAAAHYATEMKMHKHPYTNGTPARQGVEY